jgi:hypothetical protein
MAWVAQELVAGLVLEIDGQVQVEMAVALLQAWAFASQAALGT